MENSLISTLNKGFRVFIRCNTFNQSAYIKDALNGFMIQKTNFPYVCMVMDDCSTDGEQQLLIDWMTKECDMNNATEFDIPDSRVIIVPHKKNESCTFAFYLLKRNTWKEREAKFAMYKPWRESCEYEALCEGDDYWIDPLKLQKQVDFLDSHPDFSMCCSNAKVYDQRTQNFVTDVLSNSPEGEILPTILAEGNKLHTATAVYRINKCIFNEMASLGHMVIGDYILWLLCSKYGKIYRLGEETVVYRQKSGIWSTMNDVKRNVLYLMALCKVRSCIENPDVLKIFDEQIEFIKKCVFDITDSMSHTKVSKSYRLGYAILHPWSIFKRNK